MNNATAQIGLLAAAMVAAEAPWPKPVVKALADRDKIVAAARNLQAPHPSVIAAAAALALLAGADPFDDPLVRRYATMAAVGGEEGGSLARNVSNHAEQRVVDAIDPDPIVAALKAAADEAGRILVTAHEVLGDVELGEAAIILRMGPVAAQAWTDARAAEKRLRVLVSGWHALASLTRFASPELLPILRVADVDLDTFEKLGQRADAWALVRAGAVVDMADRVTARERPERIGRERLAREAGVADSFGLEYRRTHGDGRRAGVAS